MSVLRGGQECVGGQECLGGQEYVGVQEYVNIERPAANHADAFVTSIITQHVDTDKAPCRTVLGQVEVGDGCLQHFRPILPVASLMILAA